MIFEFGARATVHLEHWKRTDRTKVKRNAMLLKAIELDPYGGIGKPEPLRHELAGYWSRRIDGEHRLVYQVNGDRCDVVSCRFHYSK